MTVSSTPPVARPKRSPIIYISVGCLAVLACFVCIMAAGFGYYYLSGQDRGSQQPAVEYILDSSPRMALPAENDTGTRLAVAQGVLAEIVRPADPGVTAGLRVFGSGAQTESCRDTDLVVPMAVANQSQISTQLLTLQAGPNPDAAMGEALVSAIRDLAPTAGPHTLVVVTGGADLCNPEAGQLIAAEAQKAGITLRLFVVGYQVPDDEGEIIKGLVDEAGNGNYINARDRLELEKILESIQNFIDHPDITPVVSVLETAQAAAIGPGGQGTATPPAGSGEGTAVPTSTGEGTAVPTTTGGTFTGATACDHEFFPIRLGATWTFASADGDQTWLVTEVTGDQNRAAATMSYSVLDASGFYHWECSAAGITSFDFSSLSTVEGTTNMGVTDQSGVWLLPAEELVPGASWANDYTRHFQFTSEGQTFEFSHQVSRVFSVVGTEPMSAAGEQFDALRVNQDSTTVMSSVAGQTSSSSTAAIYYVRGIGPVRIDSTTGEFSFTSVLQSYSIP